MDTAIVLEVIRNSGPIGGMLLVLFFVGRDWKMKIEAKLDQVIAKQATIEKTLDEHTRRIIHIERGTTTQPITIPPEPEGSPT